MTLTNSKIFLSDSQRDLSNPSHPDTLAPYASYLEELYTSLSQSHTSQHWSHLPQCEFIQLAMIGAKGLRRGGPEEEMIRLAQQGKIETILDHKKSSVKLQNLFPLPAQPLVVLPPPRPQGRVCLIEGAPGGGKSTLALHICHQWAQGAFWLARFDIVVLAYLRDEAIQKALTLAEILPSDTTSSQSQHMIVSKIQALHGARVLFIFDGWDEFPHSLMSNSLVSTIIHQPHKLSLHQSNVVITSRPVASGNLLNIADRRVEIMGFTPHQIREYIEKAIGDDDTQVQKLLRHLKEHPVIEGYCYIPLHSAILVHAFLTLKGALPTTRHELFCLLVLCSIVREHATHKPDTSLSELSSLDDLPDDLKSSLSNLSVLAYNGVMQNKVIFYSKDLQSSRLPNDLPSLGLLQAVQGLTLTSKFLSYNFLHLSILELLAAYHISQMASSEQIKVFKKLFESSRFQAVLLYYCGFTKLNNPAIQEFISYQHDISSLKKILPLLHCFFETQQPFLCQLVDPEFSTNMILDYKIHNPSDYIAIGYFITSLLSMPCHSANVPPVHLSVGINDYYLLKLLLTELSKYPVEELPTAGNSSRKMVFTVRQHADSDDDGLYCKKYEPSITGLGVKLIASHLELSPAISELRIANGAIQSDREDGLLHIATALQTNSSLTKLSLLNDVHGVQYTEKNISALIKMLQVNKSLQYLELSQNTPWSVESVRIFHHFVAGLQHSTTLTHLILRNSRIPCYDPDTARSFTEMLQVNKSLTHLDLSDNSFIDSGSHCVFEGLQHNNTLVNLNLSTTGLRSTDSDTVRSLSKMFQVNKSLTHLDLSGNFLLLEGNCVFDGLRHNSTLTHLSLSNINRYSDTGPDISRSLGQMLQVNQSLTHLDLSENNLGAYYVFEGLQSNTTLVNLNLSYTGITAADPDTTRSLTKMLQVNKSLTHLDLSENKICDSGAHYVFEGLQSNTTLVNLNLSNTDITAADPDTARSLTKILQVNKSLTHIDLSENKILCDSGAHCVFEGLQSNTTLVNLNLRNTGITAADPDTARSLTKMLQVNKSLTHLDLSENNHRSASTSTNSIISHTFQGLKHNTTLLHLNIRWICMTDDDMECASQALPFFSLETLDLSFTYSYYSIKSISRILDSLKLNSSLKVLYLSRPYEETEDTIKHFKIARQDNGLPPIQIKFL